MADRRRITNHEMQLKLRNAGLAYLLENSQPFRRFVVDIFREAGVFYTPYRRGSEHDTTFHVGRHALGMELYGILKAAWPPEKGSLLGLIEAEGDITAQEQKTTQDLTEQNDDEPTDHEPPE